MVFVLFVGYWLDCYGCVCVMIVLVVGIFVLIYLVFVYFVVYLGFGMLIVL